MTREEWEMRDDPAAVEAARTNAAQQDALERIQGDQYRLDKNQNLSQAQRDRATQRLNDATANVQSGIWTPDNF